MKIKLSKFHEMMIIINIYLLLATITLVLIDFSISPISDEAMNIHGCNMTVSRVAYFMNGGTC